MARLSHKAIWRALLLALLLPALALSAVTAAGAEGDPLPPRDAWARDRPGDNGQKVDLGWSESPSPDISSYRVYRSGSPDGPFRLVGERSTDAFVNYLGFVDTGLIDGVTYYYRVTAVDRMGRESEPTPVLSAAPEAQVFQAAVTVRKSMVVSLAEQRLYCLENGRVVYVFLVSTGIASKPTPTGNFRILYHDYVHPIPKHPGTVCYYWMGFYEDYAIHAWPVYNGVQGDYSSLGRPASNGCVRLDPRLAHIPYYWAPDGTPLTIIPGRFQPPPLPVMGGHASAGVEAPSREWYFAEGFTGAGFDEYILVLNPGEEAARVSLDFMLPDGRVERREYPVSPHSRLTVGVDSIPGLENTEVSARLTSDRPVVAERAMYFGYPNADDGHACNGASETSTTWYFAEGFTGAGFDEYILVLNPGEEAARVSLDFMLPDGRVERR
ncbi:MAG: L,D-transpeptidase family protein, partial [Actinobacteria bacterium]|nr:L,D-transpeptidase family protein [Actinomycetota bacterium]